MNSMEVTLLLEAGISPEIIRKVLIAGELMTAVQRAEKKLLRGAEGEGRHNVRALEIAEAVGRMF
jgi:hypothetical protein